MKAFEVAGSIYILMKSQFDLETLPDGSVLQDQPFLRGFDISVASEITIQHCIKTWGRGGRQEGFRVQARAGLMELVMRRELVKDIFSRIWSVSEQLVT